MKGINWEVFVVKLHLLLDAPQLPLWPGEASGILGPQDLVLTQRLMSTERSEY